jgi:hypothetical protein
MDLSRRQMFSASGLILAGAATGITPATAQSRIIWGSNRGVWEKFNAAMPAGIQRSVRIYYDYDQYPQAWPQRTPGAWITLSLRPDVPKLLSGQLDTQLKAIINSAPAHSQLAFYHENEPGNPMGYPRSIANPTTAVAIQRKGMELCLGSQVKFGVIICAPANQIENWMAPRLDWYGVDQYLNSKYLRNGVLNTAKLYAHLDNDKAVFQHKSGLRHPQICFPETNAHLDEHRVRWFTALAEWGAANNCVRIQTFWNGRQGLSGPWPPSHSVIRRLRYLSELYKG